MKTRDLFYMGIIAYLAYLLSKKKNLPNTVAQLPRNTADSMARPNGDLVLGMNMDLPNLTPTPKDGMSTETALNSSNISPINKDDNEPTQIFGFQLPFELQNIGTSTISSNPLNITPKPENNPVIPTPTPIPVQTPTSTSVAGAGEAPKIVTEEVLMSECGNNFSIPNNDKEGSYTNYWFDGKYFYMQTTSPFMKTVPNTITKDLFLVGCEKFQEYKAKNGNS